MLGLRVYRVPELLDTCSSSDDLSMKAQRVSSRTSILVKPRRRRQGDRMDHTDTGTSTPERPLQTNFLEQFRADG